MGVCVCVRLGVCACMCGGASMCMRACLRAILLCMAYSVCVYVRLLEPAGMHASLRSCLPKVVTSIAS